MALGFALYAALSYASGRPGGGLGLDLEQVEERGTVYVLSGRRGRVGEGRVDGAFLPFAISLSLSLSSWTPTLAMAMAMLRERGPGWA